MTKLETLKKAWDNAPLGMTKHFFEIDGKNSPHMSRLFKNGRKDETILDAHLINIKKASKLATDEAIERNKLIQGL